MLILLTRLGYMVYNHGRQEKSWHIAAVDGESVNEATTNGVGYW